MSVSRRLVPGQIQFVTRRTSERRAFLKPDPQVNQILLYGLGVAQLRTPGLLLHAFTSEITHHHSALTDSPGVSQLSTFFGELHGMTARALNAHFGRGENFWSKPGSYDNTEVHDVEGLEEQLLYLWSQSVKDGLVESPEAWPGVLFMPEDFGKTFVVRKPDEAFFGGRRPKGHEPTYGPARRAHHARLRRERQDERRREKARDKARGRGGKRRKQLARERQRRKKKQRAPRPPRDRDTLPQEVTITISRPPGYEHLSLEEVRAHFRKLLDERVALIHAERQAEGRTRFMGVDAVLAQNPLASVGDTFPTFSRNPRIACRDTARRIALLDELVRWRGLYRAALERWREGERGVEFPHGSYWLPFFHGAETASPRSPPVAV